MKIKQLTPGQQVWNVERRGLGNTTLRDTAVFSIIVKEIDPNGRFVIASWNGNTPQKFNERSVSKWRKEKPITIAVGFGANRLANREELKAIRAQAKINAAQPAGEKCDKHNVHYSTLKVSSYGHGPAITGLTIKYCNSCREEQGFKRL